MHAPSHKSISAPVLSTIYCPKYLSGAQIIFLPCDVRYSITETAILDVTTQSAMALTSALVLAYTTTSRSGYFLQNIKNSS